MPYTVVTIPANGTSKSQSSTNFTWSIVDILHVSSKVIVGSSPGSANFYAGTEIAGRMGRRATSRATNSTLVGARGNSHSDPGVQHPGGGTLCYARPKYKKTQTGTWYTTWSNITTFTST